MVKKQRLMKKIKNMPEDKDDTSWLPLEEDEEDDEDFEDDDEGAGEGGEEEEHEEDGEEECDDPDCDAKSDNDEGVKKVVKSARGMRKMKKSHEEDEGEECDDPDCDTKSDNDEGVKKVVKSARGMRKMKKIGSQSIWTLFHVKTDKKGIPIDPLEMRPVKKQKHLDASSSSSSALQSRHGKARLRQ